MGITVEAHPQLNPILRAAAYELYEDRFTHINTLAAQRHLLTRPEFEDIAADRRITKYLAYDEDGRLVGISTLLNDLAAWPLLSPPYFARVFPDHYARQALWYIGFLGAAEDAVHVFSGLVGAMYPSVRANDGIALMDFCTANIKRGLPRVTTLMLMRLDPAVQMTMLDQQSTMAFRFDGLGETLPPAGQP